MTKKNAIEGDWYLRENGKYIAFDHPTRGQADIAEVFSEHFDEIMDPMSVSLPMKANAEFIVNACNSYRALAESHRNMLEMLKILVRHPGFSQPFEKSTTMVVILGLIAKAKEIK